MRFYVSPESIVSLKNTIEIKDKAEIHHIRDVMRIEKGDNVNVFDGQGREFSCFVEEIKKEAVIIRIKEELGFKRELNFNVTLYQAVPKKSKMDFIVEKAVELGVMKIVPVVTERTISDIESSSKKVERWRRIAIAGAKQCGRGVLPVISDIVDFNSALMDSKHKELAVFASIDKDSESLKDVLRGTSPKSIAVFVGPEGDFSPKEVSLARETGYKVCSLGNLILRSETAAIYILSCLSYELQ